MVATLALCVGLLAINISQAGAHLHIPEKLIHALPESSDKQMQHKMIPLLDSAHVLVLQNLIGLLPDAAPKTRQEYVLDIFPENIAKSIANGEVLHIVIFSYIFGIALSMLSEERKRPMLQFAESLSETMFKFTNIIMYLAPLGVEAAMAVVTSDLGTDMLFSLGKLLVTLYCALINFVVFVFGSVMAICKIPVKSFYKAIKEPVSIAFATMSSESALPKAMENMEKIGVPRKIVSFVMPIGYTFNLDGSMLYLSLVSIFVAQAAGIHLSIGQQFGIGLTLMLTSKGVAGVSRASLVILMGLQVLLIFRYGLLWPFLA